MNLKEDATEGAATADNVYYSTTPRHLADVENRVQVVNHFSAVHCLVSDELHSVFTLMKV
jgi:hypothetical protein